MDDEGIIPVLARTVRQVEADAQHGPVRPSRRTAYQVVALLVREERARIKADTEVSEGERTAVLTRLDGIATILAKTAARDTSLLQLLAEGAVVSPAAVSLKNDLLRQAGREPEPEPEPEPEVDTDPASTPRRVVPQTVIARQLANPFLAPDLSAAAAAPRPTTNRLAGWELLSPLFRAFEYGGDATCMPLPEPSDVVHGIRDLELMRHQAQVVAAAADGHRTFLLADEPGLGKTAQALLAADAADAFPLLVVVPNVVKANWAHEAELWTPRRSATVVHGDGDTTDGFADIVIVNYEILDRHVGWLGEHGFRGMVVDEAHFIKNKSSQRSRHVLRLSERIRARSANPLFMALTGTPLINDIEDFRAIWQFLGWIDDTKPRPALMAALEANGLSPGRPRVLHRRRARASSTSASSGGARSTSPPTSPPAGSPTSPSSSTTRPAARSARPSRSWPVASWRGTPPREPPARWTSTSTPSTTTSCARSRPPSARTRAPTRPATTSSR